MRLSHILVEQEFAAQDVLRLLERGDKFSDLAKRFSICPSSSDGGSLGDVPLERLDKTFADAAKKLSPGERSPIVRTHFGYHLILREA